MAAEGSVAPPRKLVSRKWSCGARFGKREEFQTVPRTRRPPSAGRGNRIRRASGPHQRAGSRGHDSNRDVFELSENRRGSWKESFYQRAET